MPAQVVLLRGVNLGPRNRVAMPALRETLAEAFGDVRTYLQSGNAVVESDRAPEEVAAETARLLRERLDLDVPVLVRTRDELAAVVALDPLGEVASEPKRYQVTFLERPLAAATLERLEAVRADPERLVAHGRELYAWHPDGVARSTLSAALADRRLGVAATARNWTTVTALLALADA